MVAIVSSPGLGVANGSLNVLGPQGVLGPDGQGRAGERVYVNSATGNLVVQNRDELVIGRGPDISLVRTYNSQGLLNDDNGDNWRLGVYRRVYNLTGTVNTVGSTVTRVAEDASESVYTYDPAQGKYVNSDGAGAFDTLSFDGATQIWTWTDGNTQVRERYDAVNGGRLAQVLDADNNALTITYAGGLITRVDDASGDTTFLDYVGNNLVDLRTVTSTGQTLIRTRYAYDTPGNRLIQVITDLSPEDASVADAKTYVVNYTYVGATNRVATLTQTDGTSLTFTYVQVGTAWKVASYTDATGQITSLAYTQTNTSVPASANANNAVLSTTETTTTTTTVAPYYTVAAGNTWASITQAVYGTSDVNAVAALQTALGNPALTAGTRLTVPQTLNYTTGTTSSSNTTVLSTTETTTTTTTVAPYYTVAAGNTWASITQAVYGTSNANAVAALQTALGNPALTAGTRLTVPQTLSYTTATTSASNAAVLSTTETTTTTTTVAPYYTVAAGNTWASITQAVYGTSDANAVAALQAALGNPALTAGTRLTVPQTLNYTTATTSSFNTAVLSTTETTTTTTTVAPYYTVAAGNTWASITQAVYGTSNANAVAALQTALGNPALTAGTRLTVPQTLNYTTSTTSSSNAAVLSTTETTTTTTTVAPYYTVVAGNTWASITQAVYGTSNANAVAALQAALGNPALTAGTRLTVPQTLNYTTSTISASNAAALSTTDTQTTTQTFNLNAGALGATGGPWTSPTALESSSADASQLLMNASNDGDAVSVWMQGGSLFASFYESDSQLLSAPVLVSGSFTNISGVQLDVDHQFGNAIVTWIDATTNKVYANRGLSNGASLTWGGAQLVATATGTLNEASGTINFDGTSAVVWRATSGTAQSLMASRWNGTAWGAAEQVTSGTVPITAPQLVATLEDVIQVVWRASDGTAESLFTRGFNAGAWGTTSALETSSVPVGLFRIDTDIWGDTNVTWVQGNDIFVNWGGEGQGWNGAVLEASSPSPIAQYAYSDSAGTNVVAWITTDSKVYANRWNGPGPELLGTGTGLSDISADINSLGQAIVSWRAGNDLYESRYAGAAWSTPGALESSSFAASTPIVTIGETGQPLAVWKQSDGTVNSIVASRLAIKALRSWEAVSNISGTAGTWTYYTIDVPAGQSELSVTTSGGTGDADFFVRYGAEPDAATYDASGFDAATADETAWIQNPAAGTWYIGVLAYTDISGVQLQAHYLSGTAGTTVLQPGIAASDLYGQSTTQRAFSFNIPAGTSGFTLSLTGQDGQDVDLFLKFGTPPNDSVFDFTSTGATANESITVNAPQAGTWFALVQGYTNYTDAALVLHTNLGTNTPPTVQAGPPRSVSSGATVTLSATGSDAQGAVTYQWTQIAGPAVTLTNAASATASFFAPGVSGPTLLDFRVKVTDSQGVTNTDVVHVMVSGSATSQSYTVKAGDTWASIATALYGSASVASQLQSALGNPALTAGNVLTGFPATLTATVTTTVTVPAYYAVKAGDTWTTITQAVYGTSTANAVAALQTALGNPALTTGAHLTMPATISYNTSNSAAANAAVLSTTITTTTTTTVAPYYTVAAGNTWASITQAVYGTSNANAVAALQTALGNPALPVGAHLTMPATISYNTAASTTANAAVLSTTITTTTTTTVAPYYTVAAGNTWASITQAVYGTSTANAVAALQAALGNPALTVGTHLTMPATISYNTSNSAAANAAVLSTTITTTTTTTVAPYYTVAAGNTWASITQAVYGTSNANAVTALQAALGNPALVTGAHLTMPATISYNTSNSATANAAVLSTTITTTTTTTVAPYYTVAAGNTWASITQAVYGTSNANAVAALQAALGNPALVTGAHLTMPATISYNTSNSATANAAVLSTTITTTTTTTVAPYYVVKAADTWSSIAQAVYGDAQAGSALQTAMGGGATPTVGAHLTVPQTLGYTKTVAGGMRTDITDPLGLITTMVTDTQGQLAQILSAAVGGVRQSVGYVYNANGDVTQVTDARGNVVTYGYDASGNRILDRDAAGNTVTRTYGAKNELLTETAFLVPDPDGAGAGQPASPLTTRYVYNATNHLRFVVSAEGRLTEYRYNTLGQRVAAIQYTGALTPTSTLTEAQLTAWVGTADKTKSLRSDSTYDFRGQLSTTTTYTQTDAGGVGIPSTATATQYIYDQSGRLLKTIDARGLATPDTTNTATPENDDDYVTTYTYDGLGRALATTEWVAAGVTRTALNTYDDANRKTVLTLVNGLVTTSTYDKAGELISVLQSANSLALGETKYFYDADGRLRRTEDPTGIKTHILYDEAGRKIGEIDGDGSLTEYRYNANNQVTKTIRYATPVSAANLASLIGTGGAPTTVTLDTIRPATSAQEDRSTWNAYDSANRLVKSVDELGFVTQRFYDGANRLTDVVRFNSPITTATLTDAPTAASINPASSTTDRLARNFYDADSKLRGTLDAEGYLVEYKYDAAGELIETVGYSKATDPSLRTSGTLAQLVAAENATETQSDLQNDIHSYTLYNAKGQVVGVVDGESYLTEYVYDAVGNKTQAIRYATPVSFTPGALLAATRPVAPNALDQASVYTYTALNQLASETNFEGTLTQYSYDAVGNLTRTVKAVNTADVRTLNAQYDKQGRLTAELSGNASALLTGNLTQAQIDAIWVANAIKHTYDAAGRRTSTTDANGNKTLFYYDADGRLTHSINARGEVQENRYNTLGQQKQKIDYGTRLNATTLGTLGALSGGGGLVNTTLTSAVAGIANVALDSVTSYSYTVRGQLASTTDPLTFKTSYTYNPFGEAITRSQAIGLGQTLDHTYDYDKRGLLTKTVWDPTVINSSESTVYDAFGRITQRTDANNNLRTQSYDRLGRVVTTKDPLTASRTTTYDAFDRVLTQRDALNNTTTFAYSNTNRSVTITTPELVSVATVHNRQGETQSVTDGRGNIRKYDYDLDGMLQKVTLTNAQGQVVSTTKNFYDKADLLTDTVDANGNTVHFAYDAVNRVLTRTVDPGAGHLNLTTTYEYDAKGQTTKVTAANNVVTQTEFDLDGQVKAVIVDPTTVNPTGLNLRTEYTYDGRGKTLTVIEGAGTPDARTTQYVYDKLGRRTEEHIDPANLNITTTYTYDKNNNVLAKTEAAGRPEARTTRYVYDANDQLKYTVGALGGVTQTDYNAEGRVLQTTSYANALVGTLAANTAPAIVTSVPTGGAYVLADAANDRTTRYVYDKDERLTFSIDSLRGVTRNVYDDNGNVIRTVAYANALVGTLAANTAPAIVASAPATGAYVLADAANDRTTRVVYDALNRATYAIDALNYVQENVYDNTGNVIRTVAYANALVGTLAPNTAPAIVASAPATGAYVLADAANDRVTRTVFDKAGRAVYAIDAAGYVKETQYDKVGHVKNTIDHGAPVFVSGTPSLEEVAAALNITATTTNVAVPYLDSPVQPFPYAAAATNDVAAPAVEAVPVQVTGGAGPQSDIVRNYAWASDGANPPTMFQVAGVSLQVPASFFGDTTPTGVRATIYRSDGTLYATTNTDVGYYTPPNDCFGPLWNGATNWNGQVNLSSSDMPAGTYTVQVDIWDDTTTDDFQDPSVSVWSFSNTLTVNIGAQPGPTLAWSSAIQPANTTAQFRYRPAGSTGAFTGMPISTANGQSQVNFALLAAGNYEFQIDYTDGYGRVLKSGSGFFTATTSGTVTLNTNFSFTRVTSTSAAGSSLSGYIAAADVPSIDKVQAVVTDMNGTVVSTALTYPEFEAGYNGKVNLKVGSVLADGRYTVAVTIFRKNGTVENRPTFIYEIGLQPKTNYFTTVSWSAVNQPADVYARFSFAPLGSSNYTDAPIVRTGDQNQITFTNPAVGTYQYYLRYYQTTTNQLLKEATGQFTATTNSVNTTVTVPFQTDGDRKTSFNYDGAGRLTGTTDALGKSESYTYDALGNKKTFTNKRGAFAGDPAYTWRYQYDALGRLTQETTPVVEVTHAALDAQGRPVVANEPIITRYTYDALGNVRTVIDAAGTAEARTTEYVYDKLGRQVSTKYPPVVLFDSGNVPVSVSSTITYDSFGNAVVNHDVRGNNSFKVYDVLGRLKYDIDANDYATEYQYDAFGNKTKSIRYAARLAVSHQDSGALWTSAQADAAVGAIKDPTSDRTVTVKYDALNHQTETVQDAVVNFDTTVHGTHTFLASPTVRFAYNAFGDVVKQSALKDTDNWVNLYSYYDRRGEKIGQVDALGYVTAWQYDAAGNLTQQVEYARTSDQARAASERLNFTAILATVPASRIGQAEADLAQGLDRITEHRYDALNRRTADVLKNVRFHETARGSTVSNGSVTVQTGVGICGAPIYETFQYNLQAVVEHAYDDLTTRYDYDAIGNVTKTTDVNGGETASFYDALGHVRAEIAPLRELELNGARVRPVVTYGYDVFGNQARVTRYATGLAEATAVGTQPPTMTVDPNDQTEYFVHNALGQLVVHIDAQAKVFNTAYDAAGNVRREWHLQTNPDAGQPDGIAETLYRYDRVGQQTVRSVRYGNGDAEIANDLARYNAFGEITARGFFAGSIANLDAGNQYANSANYFESFDYDRTGRLWRENGDTGIYRVYTYTLLGGKSGDFRSPSPSIDLGASSYKSAADIADSIVGWQGLQYKIIAYDNLGHATRQYTTVFSDGLGGTLAPEILQTVDRWGNVLESRTPVGKGDSSTTTTSQTGTDFCGNPIYETTMTATGEGVLTSRYAYNYANQVTQEQKLGIDVTDEHGVTTRTNLTTNYFYDAHGRVLKVADANHDSSIRIYNQAGQVLADMTGMGTSEMQKSGYDVLGREINVYAPSYASSGRHVTRDYDHNNRIIKEQNGREVKVYTYDEADNRTSETLFGNVGSSLVVQQGTGVCGIPIYDYEIVGNAAETRQFIYNNRSDLIESREPLFAEDPKYTTRTSYDAKGNKIRVVDANGNDQNWSFDGTPASVNAMTSDRYFGRLTSYQDIGDGVTAYSYNRLNQFTSETISRGAMTPLTKTYDYYENGQLKQITDSGADSNTFTYRYDAAGNQVYEAAQSEFNKQESFVAYDKLNRIRRVLDQRAQHVAADISYDYDAVGNRRSVKADYRDSGFTQRHTENWYEYDFANRVVRAKGVLQLDATTGQNEITQGMQVLYDVDGNRAIAQTSAFGAFEIYGYNKEGRLESTSTVRYFDNVNPTTIRLNQRQYDDAGRLITYTTFNEDATNAVREIQSTTYNRNGWVLDQTTKDAGGGLRSVLQYFGGFNTLGYDAMGNPLGYHLTNYVGQSYENQVTYTYALYNTYKELQVDGTSSFFESGNTLVTYDIEGNVVSIRDGKASQTYRSFVIDAEGRILTKNKGAEVAHYFYANGRPIGAAGKSDGQELADFDFNFSPISPSYPSATPSTYVVNKGDTLQSIAQAVYGDASMWYLIADANGLRGGTALTVGAALTIPNAVSNIHNNSDTFKPYNPREIIGDLTPTMPAPQPPKKKGCDTFIMVVVIVVAIVATVITAGAAAVAMGANMGIWAAGTAALSGGLGFVGVAAAVIGGAVGSAASQLVGMGLGSGQKFSWRAVATGALASGATAGLGALGQGGVAAQMGVTNTYAQAAVNGMVSNAVTQGINIVTGQPHKFDWKGFVFAGISAAASKYIGSTEFGKSIGIGADPQAARQFSWSNLAAQTVGGIAKGAVVQAFRNHGKVDWKNVGADAFGNALGNSVVAAAKYDEATRPYEQRVPSATEARVVDGQTAAKDARTPPLMFADTGKFAPVMNDAGTNPAETEPRDLSRTGGTSRPDSVSSQPGDGTISSSAAEMLNPSKFSWSGVANFFKGAADWVIGENYGAAWKSLFTDNWVTELADGRRLPTGMSLPESIAAGMADVRERVPDDAGANGMHAWHAGSNAYFAQQFGIIGAPLLFLAGVYHESPLDWKSFKAEQEFQGTVNHVLDSGMDIVANVFGMTVGYLVPGQAGVDFAIRAGNYIPGPGDPDPEFGGKGAYKGNPLDAWGQYPK